MAGKVLLDTNIVIAILRHDPGVVASLAGATKAYISTVALGELFYGAARSRRASANRARVTKFLGRTRLLHADRETAAVYGRLKAELDARGRRIPDNDLWIAASALQHGLSLASRDAHFADVPDLAVERW